MIIKILIFSTTLAFINKIVIPNKSKKYKAFVSGCVGLLLGYVFSFF
jgi:hypothetical protein